MYTMDLPKFIVSNQKEEPIRVKRERELFALLSLSSWCLVIVVWLFLTVPWGCLQFVIVVFPDHTHLLFFKMPMTVKLRLV